MEKMAGLGLFSKKLTDMFKRFLIKGKVGGLRCYSPKNVEGI